MARRDLMLEEMGLAPVCACAEPLCPRRLMSPTSSQQQT
jgi:hypothetical protein